MVNANVGKALAVENAISAGLITGVIHPTILVGLVSAIRWGLPPNSVTTQRVPASACQVWVARNVIGALVDTLAVLFPTVNHAANVSTTGTAFFRYFCKSEKL
jgi:hypothetical protein